jgi:hypothetical protein
MSSNRSELERWRGRIEETINNIKETVDRIDSVFADIQTRIQNMEKCNDKTQIWITTHEKLHTNDLAHIKAEKEQIEKDKNDAFKKYIFVFSTIVSIATIIINYLMKIWHI